MIPLNKSNSFYLVIIAVVVVVLLYFSVIAFHKLRLVRWRNQMLESIKQEHNQLRESRQDEVQRFFWSVNRGDSEEQIESRRTEIIAVDESLERLRSNYEYLKKCSFSELAELYKDDCDARQQTQAMFKQFGSRNPQRKQFNIIADDIHTSLLSRVLRDDLRNTKDAKLRDLDRHSGWEAADVLEQSELSEDDDAWVNESHTESANTSDEGAEIVWSGSRRSRDVAEYRRREFQRPTTRRSSGPIEDGIKYGIEERLGDRIRSCRRSRRQVKRRKTDDLSVNSCSSWGQEFEPGQILSQQHGRDDSNDRLNEISHRIDELKMSYRLSQLRQRKKQNLLTHLDRID